MPKISVVMPSYNRETLIQNAIRSIIDQTFKSWELVIIDDGSEDGTQRVVESFAYPNIQYKRVEHSGHITKLRNMGNKLARGELIVVQDADDMSFPNRLEELWKIFIRTQADIIYHSMYLRFFDPFHNAIVRDVRPAKPFNLQQLLHTQYIPGQVAYRRSRILETPYNEEVIICDDYIMLLEFALKGYKFHRLESYLYDYFESPDSVNVEAEADGRRAKDAETIKRILRTTYKQNI